MTIEEMHYDFKVKFNKVDSQNNRNLLIPEIDWLLNEAQEIFVKAIAEPRLPNSYLGFETSQRTIDDIRTIVVPDVERTVTNNVASLPDNYWFFVKATATMTRGTSPNVQTAEAIVFIRQQDDLFEISDFDKSSFEWRTVNAVFNTNGIKVFTNGFTVTKLSITYLKKLDYIHNATKFPGGTYNLPSGVALSGTKNCELPPHTHREIVDIAVMLASGNLQLPDYNIKKDKINNVNQLN